MSTLNCLCADPLINISVDNCDATKYGNQIVKVFVQKMEGTTFDGSLGFDATVEADWDTALAAVNDDKIVVIDNIIGTRESAEPTIEEGNDVRYGGVEIIDRPQQINFSMKYFSSTIFAEIDKVACWGKVRVWFLDNNNYLWGSELAVATTSGGNGVEDANIIMTTMGQTGIGTRNKMENCQIRWNNLCQPTEVGQFAFLKNK